VALTEFAIGLQTPGSPRAACRWRRRAIPRTAAPHVALVHPDAKRLCAALIERGVIPDFRRPNVIRFGLSPLTTRFTDVWDAVETLRTLL